MALLAVVALVVAVGTAAASTVVGLSIEDQARLSRYVVVGEVMTTRGLDHPRHGIETAVTLRVAEVLKGDVRVGQPLTFHLRGGQVKDVISEALGEATVSPGQRVLVFVEEVEGRLYNLGLSMGVWDVSEDESGTPRATRALRDGLQVVGGTEIEYGPLALDEMHGRVRESIRNPRFDNEMLRSAREGR
jgi:hypothetical protein